MKVELRVRLKTASERAEGREHRAPFLRHLSVCGQDLRCLTAIRLVEFVGWRSSHRVVYDCEGGLTSDRTEAQTEGLERFRR